MSIFPLKIFISIVTYSKSDRYKKKSSKIAFYNICSTELIFLTTFLKGLVNYNSVIDMLLNFTVVIKVK